MSGYVKDVGELDPDLSLVKPVKMGLGRKTNKVARQVDMCKGVFELGAYQMAASGPIFDLEGCPLWVMEDEHVFVDVLHPG